jgi:hypothetical protein
MERVEIYKPMKDWNKVRIYLGLVFLCLGLYFLIHYLRSDHKIDLVNWIFIVALSLQGLHSFLYGYLRLKEKRRFIEWDDKEIRYLLLTDQSIGTITISDIQAVTFKLLEISIKLNGSEKRLQLEGIVYQDLKKVKELFERIHRDIESRP